jgi:NAD(P)H dehydrogenase (quinone)
LVLQSGAGAARESAISQAQEHAKADDYVKASGLAFTILQPYFFMQNLLNQADAIKSQGAVYGNFRGGKLAMVDARDIAAVVVACMLGGADHEGRTYVITGSEAITHADVAHTLSTVLGKAIRYVDLPAQQFVKAVTDAGTPEWLARDLGMLGENIAAGQFARITDVVEKISKRRPSSFEQFVKDNAEAFS